MQIKSAEFIISNSEVSKCPTEKLPEYAFIGRSNVGKSSLINMLTGRNKLAKTSSTPGKTQLINHFKINKNWFLVDLPGYGYARVSRTTKKEFQSFITDYFKQRKELVCTFVLIDSRHTPQKVDVDFMEFLAENEIPFVIIFTKTDKLKPNAILQNITKYKETMLKGNWADFPMYFTSSSTSKNGKEDILNFIDSINKDFNTGNL
ncbi:ribosome biogenesis GTP-binding protein YihA/YsxC [Wenyingzhuangia sp. 2_MG-2023]|uniref:ribosome biogenesis GTP-binding protein YihA/YsxC n=1 Tax=Wenyingzhuangia sp. 2_MG-2023 TaxID=3062639 RepID=UPI0026E291B9|nr:ribosome biogenesis GTP-binding protein YihA/YsxC [Wenyingzhuangia sp. 2_MG-2023]MDO6737702.1 ribosome biogenesis GTP-binding protein YihA/YsxC [Wenyingzhuangia sp. 2_MG-2023]MDO6802541.1 ribosome biogenesis GTP-binding protein YihA/YsxC [Wenyingzhuangia sp. 1_MG-2023]